MSESPPLAAVIPLRPTAAPAPPPGYLGLTQRTFEVDSSCVAQYGPCVIVASRSPAWKAGLRSDDFVTTINDQTFDAFHASMPAAGVHFRIVAYRKGIGELRTFGNLTRPPKPKPEPEWGTAQGVLPSLLVERGDRAEYMNFVTTHPDLKSRDTRLLQVLLNFQWDRGIIPSHASIAEKMRCHRSTVKRAIARCQHFGFLRVVSGKPSYTSNSYQVCWPGPSRPKRKR
jgi:hypothetical protein